MDKPIFDGECHALSEKFGYIAKKITDVYDNTSLSEFIDDELLKYAEYLYQNDKDKVIEYLMTIFRNQVIHQYTDDNHLIIHQCTDENYQVIYRPPWIVGALSQYATLVLKFQRSEKDNLKEENA